ncbi:protocatechuate 3,4-dioxygenase subunit alpha [Sinorhizobium alkalisoli]|uniref:protocatechuate 3,4-dioxygenase subunit alpha n=1 Tax=Sinorhizobium alkalisoli TaxID=1752398 RepID=UPI00124CC392|nr:protocatechuate 3,4-dioxygenase subunit alpha [Sinorhizobium alkalisoli]QFI69677.1 Protocatechuate 3,4-dioxygenase alpha chain [Sinorhizobium alkalisoli]
MVQDLGYLKETASQTAGPYVHIGLTPNFCGIPGVYESDLGSAMVNDKTLGERITVTGRVIDGAGVPLKDALIEIWQADAAGLYNSPSELRGHADPNFAGWGRCPTGADDGVFTFRTVKPGRVPARDGRPMAPHITFWIIARGINLGLHTRMYFPDEPAANAEDPLLGRIEHRHRTQTLVAGGTAPNYVFDIHLQGEKETVFLDI